MHNIYVCFPLTISSHLFPNNKIFLLSAEWVDILFTDDSHGSKSIHGRLMFCLVTSLHGLHATVLWPDFMGSMSLSRDLTAWAPCNCPVTWLHGLHATVPWPDCMGSMPLSRDLTAWAPCHCPVTSLHGLHATVPWPDCMGSMSLSRDLTAWAPCHCPVTWLHELHATVLSKLTIV